MISASDFDRTAIDVISQLNILTSDHTTFSKDSDMHSDQEQVGRYRAVGILISGLFLVMGLVLCCLGYGTQFWGNWIHTSSFNGGLIMVCGAVSAIAGSMSLSSRVGWGLFAFFLITIGLFLWTYPGWLLLHTLINALVK